ncbi:hypothetical protein [Candidatus Venteria ishoeyi]|uniref:hypothetical protein n=1 Tax=Candidatus Venteria ishoeyi TaxID=1899563 RepID=UPI000CDF17F7|nr:hypothetical protein [Candidatus Venteria ishoeyi]
MKNLILLMSLWLSGPASATTEQMLSNWFKNDTQKTAELFQQGQYEKAAKSFKDNYRRSIFPFWIPALFQLKRSQPPFCKPAA